MKIIKEGRKDEAWSRQVVCTSCEAVLEVEFTDLYRCHRTATAKVLGLTSTAHPAGRSSA